MATAPTIAHANLSPGGGLVAPPAAKKPVYSVRELGSTRPQHSLIYRPTATPARRPKRVLFGAITHPMLRVLRPIPVEISYRQGRYVARFRAADEFGAGSTMSLALEDLGKTLSELFLGLTERRESLGSDLNDLCNQLSRFIAHRP